MSVPPSLDGYSSSSKRTAAAALQGREGRAGEERAREERAGEERARNEGNRAEGNRGDLEPGADLDQAVAEVAPDYELRPSPRNPDPAGARQAVDRTPGAHQRIYLVGAHSTGKTTLARWVRDRFGLPMISEVARGVLAEMEAQLDALRSDVELVNRYQRQVFERQLDAERQQRGGFVSDRAFCNLAYAAHHSTVLSGIATDPRLRDYMESVRSGIVLYLRPHRELVRADGVRAGLEWEEVVRIDGMVKLLLEMFAVPYVAVESLSMQERVRTVETILGLAGVHPVAEAELPRASAAQG